MKWLVHILQHSPIPFALMVSGLPAFNFIFGKRLRGNRLVHLGGNRLAQIVVFVWLLLCVVLLVMFIGWGHF
jgi:hypothetical protein